MHLVQLRKRTVQQKNITQNKKIFKSLFENLTDVNWKWNELGAEFYNMGMMVINSKKFLSF